MGFVFWKWDEHVCPGHCWSISPLRHRWVNLRSTLNDRECQWTTTMTGDGWNLTTKMVMGMVYWVSHITLICSRSFGLQNISNIQVWIWIRPTTTNHFLNGFNGNRPWFNPHHSIHVSGRGGVVPWRETVNGVNGVNAAGAQRRGGFWKLSREQPKRCGKFTQKKNMIEPKFGIMYIYI